MLNERVLAVLPNSGETIQGSTVSAQLLQWFQGELEASTAPLWEFLYNPQTIHYSVRANYAELAGLSQNIPHQQYQNSEGARLTLSNLVLDGWWRGKVVQPLVNGLVSLTRASQDEHPPIMSLVLSGRTVLAPCVLTSVDVVESAWAASGEATVASVNLTLLEVHSDAIDSTGIDIPTLADTSDDRPILPLTDRQQSEAQNEADAWIASNFSSFSPLIQSVIQTDYSFSVDPDLGDVRLLDNSGGNLGIAGRWDGRNFKASSELIS